MWSQGSLNVYEECKSIGVREKHLRKIWPVITGFENGRELQFKECRKCLEAWKGKKNKFPLEPLKRNTAFPIQWLSTRETTKTVR